MVLFLLSLALVLSLGMPTLQAEFSSEGLLISAEATAQGLTVKAGGLWNFQGFSPQLSATWTPQVPTCTITFTTDSLSCVLVKPGQALKEGDLIGYASLAARERIAWLEKQLPEVDDETLRAEVSEEIQRLRRENEIRALIPGRVTQVALQQQSQVVRVEVFLAPCKR